MISSRDRARLGAALARPKWIVALHGCWLGIALLGLALIGFGFSMSALAGTLPFAVPWLPGLVLGAAFLPCSSAVVVAAWALLRLFGAADPTADRLRRLASARATLVTAFVPLVLASCLTPYVGVFALLLAEIQFGG